MTAVDVEDEPVAEPQVCDMHGCERVATHRAGWQADGGQSGVYCRRDAMLADWSAPLT